MGREVQVSSSGVNDLGYHVVWCAKCRRPVLAGPAEDCCEMLLQEKAARRRWRIKGLTSHALRAEFPRLRSRLPTLWSRSYFTATVGASAVTAQRYIDTQYERPWRKGKTR